MYYLSAIERFTVNGAIQYITITYLHKCKNVQRTCGIHVYNPAYSITTATEELTLHGITPSQHYMQLLVNWKGN